MENTNRQARYFDLLLYIKQQLKEKLGEGYFIMGYEYANVPMKTTLFRVTAEQFHIAQETNTPPHREQFVIINPAKERGDEIISVSYVRDAVAYYNGPIPSLTGDYNDTEEDITTAVNEIINFLVNGVEPNGGMASTPMTMH